MTTYVLTRETWLSPDETARILGLSYSQVQRLMASSHVRTARLPNGQRRICRQDIEALLQRGLLGPPSQKGH